MNTVADFITTSGFVHDGLKQYYASLIEKFQQLELADAHFESELTSGDEDKFWQRVWEAILGCHFDELGYRPSSVAEGPDFCIYPDGKLVWVEAICPRPKDVPPEFIKLPEAGEVRDVNLPEALTLNWTSALKEKMEKLEGRKGPAGNGIPGYRAKGIVGTTNRT